MRIKRSVQAKKKRKKIFKSTKGFLSSRKSCYRKAKEASIKAGKYAYRDRKNKKRTNRALWQIRIGNATRKQELSYSSFIHFLKKEKIELNRKVLAEIAVAYPLVFEKIVQGVKKTK